MEMKYQATKKMWRNKLVIERSQSEKATYCRILTTWNSGDSKRIWTARDSKRIKGCQGLGSGEGWIGRAQRIFRAGKS